MALPAEWANRLSVPVFVAPMTDVSSPALIRAAAKNGVVSAIPSHNLSEAQLAPTLDAIQRSVDAVPNAAPWGVNVIVHRSNGRRDRDVACVAKHRVDFVVASVGSPEPVVGPLQAAGTLVFADVASMRHVERALEAGVDGLVALCAGAGGQTGKLNPFAFIRAIRAVYDGPVALAGGITDGVALRAACAAGADLGYLGTRFIATEESAASEAYKAAVVKAGIDDVTTDLSMTGLPANVLRAAPRALPPPAGFQQDALLANRDAWSAGHGVGAVRDHESTAAVVGRLRREWRGLLHGSTSAPADRGVLGPP
jgi:nitronate monooxygenase